MVPRRRSPDPAQKHSDDQTKAPQQTQIADGQTMPTAQSPDGVVTKPASEKADPMENRGSVNTASEAVSSLKISDVQIIGKRRALDEETVRVLAASMKEIGLRMPISVRAFETVDPVTAAVTTAFALVAGYHRLEAAKLNAWAHIDAVVTNDGEPVARRWLIEENLLRSEFIVLDRAEAIAEWVRLAEAQVPAEVRVCGQVVVISQVGRPEGGIAKAARCLPVPGKTEQARRKAIERAIKVDKIAPEAKEAARAAGLSDNQSALFAIAHEPTPEAQLLKVEELSASKRARPKRNNSTPVGGIGGEAPVAGSPASTPAVPPNTGTNPDGEDLDIPECLNRRDPAERTFAGLKAEWQNSEPFRHAWGNAPVAIRDKFYAEKMQSYRE
jgi:ParB family chromosome partitioning protein